MPGAKPITVGQALRVAYGAMPPSGDLDGMLTALAAWRQRPIVVLDHPFDTGADPTNGVCVPTEIADYIFVDALTTPTRRAATICHEVAHLLLGHAGDIDLVRDVAAPDLDPRLIERMLARHSYDSVEENNAETMATRLVAEHRRRAGRNETADSGIGRIG